MVSTAAVCISEMDIGSAVGVLSTSLLLHAERESITNIKNRYFKDFFMRLLTQVSMACFAKDSSPHSYKGVD
jgi:hypothetical protein